MASPRSFKPPQPGSALATLERANLTELQKKFIVEFVNCQGDVSKTVATAGMSREGALKYLKTPHVLEAIRRYVLMEFQSDAVKARATLVEVMEDIDSPPMVRRQCAIDILQIASLDLPWTQAGDSLGNLDTSKLSEEEKDRLEQLLAKMQPDPTCDPEAIDAEATVEDDDC